MGELYEKYKEIINYLIFGVLTTIINIITYYIVADVLKINYLVSNILAWVLSVLFAYITNKIYVFESKTTGFKEALRECISFFICRSFSGLIDMGFMYIMVDLILFPGILAKVISNIVVIILNYILSKLLIFKNKK